MEVCVYGVACFVWKTAVSGTPRSFGKAQPDSEMIARVRGFIVDYDNTKRRIFCEFTIEYRFSIRKTMGFRM
jgi:hypothetical protein